MTNIIFLVACAFFLGVPDANSYQNAIKMRRRSPYIQCFDPFHPIISPITNTLRKASRLCIITANAQKNDQLAILETSRLELVEEMQRFKESMNNCTTNKDQLGYPDCVSNVIRIDREKVNIISSRFDSNGMMEEQIERNKHACIQEAVNRGQEESFQAFRDLEDCISNARIY